MKVVSIRSRMLFGKFYPRADEMKTEGIMFVVGAALTIYAPMLLFCHVIGQFLPLYLMVCNGALGVLWGFLMFKRQLDSFAPCVPVNIIPDVLSDAHTTDTKRVA